MNIRPIRLTAAFLLLMVCLPTALFAQSATRENYLERYNSLVSKVGADGLGVESLLNHWEADYPED